MAKLVVRADQSEHVVEIKEKVTTVGRSRENTIEIDDINSSRRHCEIIRLDGGRGFEIVDLGSRNGTLVNGILVLRQKLHPGDCIEIGRTRMYFEDSTQPDGVKTMDLGTEYFLEPLSDLEGESQLEVLRREREIFLKLLEINKSLNTKQVLKDLLDTIMDTVVEVTRAERGFVILAGDGEMKVEVSRNMDRERVRKDRLKVSQSIARWVLERGEPVISTNAKTDARFSEFQSVQGLSLTSVLCAPLKAQGKAVGVIYIDNRFQEGAFTRSHLRWLEILGEQAAIAIVNARLFEENRLRREELERAKTQVERMNQELENKVICQAGELEDALESLPAKRPTHLKYNYDNIITRSHKMFAIFEILDKVADSNVPVLIQGESGTGKELVARAIHQNGPRARKAFVTENCASIPANLMESEFFGHVRGSFTGAIRDKKGLFEVAHEGTLFLDEIAEMSPEMQTKFLRVLQDGEIRRVGGREVIKVNVRIVSATNQDLARLVREGRFREDLYYRLNVIKISLPPLREKKEDLPLLIDHFLTRIAARTHTQKKTIHRETFNLLYQYDWPGNVRELENEIERLAALSRGKGIETRYLSEAIRGQAESGPPPGRTLREVVSQAVEEVERDVIRSILAESGWKKTRAANLLGISRPTLDAKIEKYNLKKDG